MANHHLIGQQIIELKLDCHEEALQVQQEMSRLYWEEIAPAFDKLFDRLAGPDILVRLDRLEIDLGTISTQDLHARFLVEQMVSLLEAAIKKARQEDLFGVVTQPIYVGRFHLWLYFLEHGYLPAHAAYPKPLTNWYSDIFQTLVREANAVDSLSRLVSTFPQAMERLIIQYDPSFLQQLVELFTGFKQDPLSAKISETAGLIAQAIQTLSEYIEKERSGKIETADKTVADLLALILQLIPSLKKDRFRQDNLKNKLLSKVKQKPDPGLEIWEWLAENDFLRSVLEQEASQKEIQAIPAKIARIMAGMAGKKKLLSESPFVGTSKEKLLRQLEIDSWSILLHEVLVLRKKASSDELITVLLSHKKIDPWHIMLGKEFFGSNWKKLAESKQTLEKRADNKVLQEELRRNQPIIQKQLSDKVLPDVAEKTFFIPNAGMILLHPFLSTFFQKLKLLKDRKFPDTWHQQKAVLILHYLATEEDRSTEFQLVLPKHLMGWPLNMPLDHTISISPEENTEGKNLLVAVIDHWGALGSTSIEGLREGFLQREGKLEKKPDSWLLTVEHKAIDILLDKLPWNLSVIKFPWMKDFLKVEWK